MENMKGPISSSLPPGVSLEERQRKTVNEDLRKELLNYQAHKRRKTLVADLLITQFPQYSKQYFKMISCGNNLHYWHFPRVDQWRLKDGMTCQQHLLCGGCARRRAIRQSFSYGEKVKLLLEQNPELTPVLITRTVKNRLSLSESWTSLNQAHRKLTVRRRNAMSASSTVRGSRTKNSPMRLIEGGAGTYEFKKGKNSGLWHPHSHEVALLAPGVPFRRHKKTIKYTCPETGNKQFKDVYYFCPDAFQQELAEEWFSVTGDSFIVDVRRIDTSDSESYIGGMLEVFSYTLKSSSLSPADQIHAYQTLCRGSRVRRLIYSYGNLRGVEVPETDRDIVEKELMWETYVDRFFYYDRKRREYIYDKAHSALQEQLYTGDYLPGSTKTAPVNHLNSLQNVKDAELVAQFAEEGAGGFCRPSDA